MVRLIATDIDGTLLEEGSTCLNPEYFDIILKLAERGIHFAVATGRPEISVRKTFAPVIRAAGIGCAVANARQEVRDAADRIVPGYAEDGVLAEIKKLVY